MSQFFKADLSRLECYQRDLNLFKLKTVLSSPAIHKKSQTLPPINPMNSSLVDLARSGVISPEDIHPGNPLYRMLIRQYYLTKDKSDSEGTIGGFVFTANSESL
jgi:hypothetical protein